MKFLLHAIVIVLCVLHGSFSAFAQRTADTDTFRVDNMAFTWATPENWFSLGTRDGLQKDTTWNYKMRYAPPDNPENTMAEMWVHIVDNSADTAPTRQRWIFKRTYTVGQSSLNNWPCYQVKYEPERVKGCRECGSVYTEGFSVPLNQKQSLEIVFVGQGQNKEIYPLQISFALIAADFVKANHKSLCAFRVINFNAPLASDIFMVGSYIAKFPVAPDFSRGPKESEIGSEGVTIFGNKVPDSFRMTSPDGLFSISVVGATVPLSDSAKIMTASDTAISLLVSRTPYGYNWSKLKTRRAIKADSSNMIVFSFELKMPIMDAVWTTYYENILAEYVDVFVSANQGAIRHEEPVKLSLPAPQQFKKPDPLQPKRNGTLPRK